MKRFHGNQLLFFFFYTLLMAAAVGCGKKEKEGTRIADLEYTVIEEGEVPAELFEKIKEGKTAPFSVTYRTEGYLYIARGYGTKPSGGYSIRVTQLYETEEGIVFESELLGPGREEPVLQMETHPYIVIKLQDIGKELCTWN